MRKFYFLGIAIALAFFSINISAQNLLKGSDMEAADSTAWDTSSLANGAGNTIGYEFGYTAATPTDGTGGCLHMYGTNVGGNGTHICVYQAVTIHRGHHYHFDMALKAVAPLSNQWIEAYMVDTVITGQDLSTGKIGGVSAGATWGSCPAAQDGMLSVVSATPCEGYKDSLMVAGTGDTTVYIAIKAGTWDNAGYDLDVVIDSPTLTDLDATTGINTTQVNALTVYPNPANNVLNVSSGLKISSVDVMNVLGQKVNADFKNNTIDVSALAAGIYIVKVTDANNNVYMTKFRKK